MPGSGTTVTLIVCIKKLDVEVEPVRAIAVPFETLIAVDGVYTSKLPLKSVTPVYRSICDPATVRLAPSARSAPTPPRSFSTPKAKQTKT